jgi:uncharacterized protein YbjT (DUF2867 family)/uncharacterized membrane protein YphA (DoxX/SURF4 family)
LKRVLVTGASGFLGRHIVAGLRARGHGVICAQRSREPGEDCADIIGIDFADDVTPEQWVRHLRGVHTVINAVGILKEHGRQTFRSLHVESPGVLFEACANAGVEHVIQISALGADENATSRYHLSKRQADQFLRTLPVGWTVVQPSLVYGSDGASARLFTTLASLPWIPLPAGGKQLVQPIHVDDVTAGIVALVETEATRSTVPFVGPAALTLRDYLQALRTSLGFGQAWFFSIPLSMLHTAARVGARLPRSLLDPDSLGMLMRGNTGDSGPLRRLLGRPPRSAQHFVSETERTEIRQRAALAWLLPLLRLSIAAVWIVTGIVSLGVFPAEASYALLQRAGVPRGLAPLFLYSAAILDLVLGVATLVLRRRRALWLAQIALMLGYTAIISIRLPEFWIHPYGPILKNLPMLVALILLYQLEKR